eukprot:GHUV01052639.1.p2 GENE.GHUV01052639.1~~GHUV01052639.1.p2  ORF type:complete len:139 (-),score=30.61 GHUV01052639.1:20-436(-)
MVQLVNRRSAAHWLIRQSIAPFVLALVAASWLIMVLGSQHPCLPAHSMPNSTEARESKKSGQAVCGVSCRYVEEYHMSDIEKELGVDREQLVSYLQLAANTEWTILLQCITNHHVPRCFYVPVLELVDMAQLVLLLVL